LGAAAAGILPILHQKILLYGFYIRIFVCNPALRDNLGEVLVNRQGAKDAKKSLWVRSDPGRKIQDQNRPSPGGR